MSSGRRTFLRQFTAGAAAQTALPVAAIETARQCCGPESRECCAPEGEHSGRVAFPRTFKGPHLAMIAFPLGGVGAGSVSLGGRGQLRDWEIFNKPDKGRSPQYAFASIFVDDGKRKIARVLESRHLPPFTGENGLGHRNVAGLSRFASAKFTGQYPLARIDFEDTSVPVRASLEAFSPFIPHEEDDSGLPVAVLRYRVRNPAKRAVKVSIAWSLDNPVVSEQGPPPRPQNEQRINEYRSGREVSGLYMYNPSLATDDPMRGSVVLAAIAGPDAGLTHLRGWPRGRWWDSPLLYWDDFTADGQLGPEPDQRGITGALCLSQTIAPGAEQEYTFLLAWHFPNRTPSRCGWYAPKGDENTIIGNWYAERFPDAWAAAEYTAANLQRLESKTRLFASALANSTLPASILDAASANLSTLATTTCFRTADGEFRGFEGSNDKRGCCPGNCTHVWNYETVTPFLFPCFARSLRRAAFGHSMDEQGGIRFRTFVPEGKARSEFTAADGQMGQILHAYLDWKLSGDTAWLKKLWPRLKLALEFSWIPGGWDADRDGVMGGVQHNTYDVEFYGPNPHSGIYYLAALRACEQMAGVAGDPEAAAEYGRLYRNGRKWIDGNLFNGDYYIQKVRGFPKDQIAPVLRSHMGSEDTENPQYQMGSGCLVDQLVGQYLADVAGLGPVLNPANIRRTLESIFRHNLRASLIQHDSVQRTYVVNDEAALIMCDYGGAERPRIPFPYFAEAWTGTEYSTAAQMIYAGMVREGVQCFDNVRKRYDGQRRNPWDEPECGHHYARAMAAWSGLLAFSGFRHDGHEATVSVLPASRKAEFRCFWSTANGWGVFTMKRSAKKTTLAIRIHSGSLQVGTVSFRAAGAGVSAARLGDRALPHIMMHEREVITFRLNSPVSADEGADLVFDVGV